jgi:hypothetical protein
MTTPMNARPEDSHTYMVQNRFSQGELKRLQIQDQMITSSMGVLSELRPGTERRGKLSPLPLQKGPFWRCLSPHFAPFGTVFPHLTQAFPAVV